MSSISQNIPIITKVNVDEQIASIIHSERLFTKRDYTEQLFNLLSDKIKIEKSVPMKNHTSFKVGGPADYFARPATVTELVQLIEIIRKKNIPFISKYSSDNTISMQPCSTEIPCTIMGGGTNILVKDSGIRGFVISLARMKDEIKITELNPEHTGIVEQFYFSCNGLLCSSKSILSEHVIVSASSGTSLAALCRKTIKLGLEDFSFAAGIPGTVGGAIMMNAGTGIGTISDRLVSVDILDKHNDIKTINKSELKFSHRRVEFPESILSDSIFSSKPIILRASFLLTKGSREKVEKSWASLIEKRKSSQPHGVASAGCFFKNPVKDTLMSAGQLIDMAGLKKKRVGDAMVSDKHANFIINLGNATASQIIALKNIVKESVLEKFGIHLSEEVVIQGE